MNNMKKKRLYSLIFLSIFLVAVIAGIIFIQKKSGSNITINTVFNINPAAKYCTDNNGIIESRQRGDGSSYDVCVFEGNKQCEKEAMKSGECPLGGVSMVRYITNSSVYCAVLGGKYEKDSATTGLEKGTCSFFNGNICDVDDLYDGKCDKGSGSFSLYQDNNYNFSLKIPKAWDGKYAVNNESGADGIVYVSFNYDFNGSVFNIFKVAVVPSSAWENQNVTLKDNYLSRDDSHFFAAVYPSDKTSDQGYAAVAAGTVNVLSTFSITKPYIFSEKYNESGSNYSIEEMIPSVGAVDGKVDIAIISFVDGIVSDFKNKVGASGAWRGDNTFKIFYQPYEVNSNFVSIMFETEEYTGGAHPDSSYYGFNYDIKNEKIVGLVDIFSKDYVKSISDKSISYLSKLNQSQPFTNDEWINEGAGPKADNFKNFCFNKDTVVFYMNPSQVGSYAAGMQEIIMPISSLESILNKEEASDLGIN